MADPDTPRAIRISDLSAGTRFESALFHRDGTLLLLANAAVDGALLRALGLARIEEVFLCESEAATRRVQGYGSPNSRTKRRRIGRFRP